MGSSHRLVEALAAQSGGRRKRSVGEVEREGGVPLGPSAVEEEEGGGKGGEEGVEVAKKTRKDRGKEEEAAEGEGEEGAGEGGAGRLGSLSTSKGRRTSALGLSHSSLQPSFATSPSLEASAEVVGAGGGWEEGEYNDLDVSVDLVDEEQPLLSRGDRLQRRRAEVEKLVQRCQGYRVLLQEGVGVEVMEVLLPPSPAPPSSPSHPFPPSLPPSCTFHPVKMRVEGLLSPSRLSDPDPTSPLALPIGNEDLVKARLVWEDDKHHPSKRGSFFQSLGWGRTRRMSSLGTTTASLGPGAQAVPDAIHLTELYGVVRGLRRIRPKAVYLAAAAAVMAAAEGEAGGEGGMEHSRLLTLTTLQLPQKPRRGLVLRFPRREDRNAFLDGLRKCLGDLLQVDLSPATLEGLGEGGGEGRGEVSVWAKLLRERAKARPAFVREGEEGAEGGKEGEDGALYVSLADAQAVLGAERREIKRTFGLLLDTEFDVNGLEDENRGLRAEVTRLALTLKGKDTELERAHHEQKGEGWGGGWQDRTGGGREGGRVGHKTLISDVTDVGRREAEHALE